MSKKVIPEKTYQGIKDMIIAKQAGEVGRAAELSPPRPV